MYTVTDQRTRLLDIGG